MGLARVSVGLWVGWTGTPELAGFAGVCGARWLLGLECPGGWAEGVGGDIPRVPLSVPDPCPCCGTPGLRAAVYLRETPDHALCHEVPPRPPRACWTTRPQGECTGPCGGDVPSLSRARRPIRAQRGKQGPLPNRTFPGADTLVRGWAAGRGAGLFRKAHRMTVIVLVIPQTKRAPSKCCVFFLLCRI